MLQEGGVKKEEPAIPKASHMSLHFVKLDGAPQEEQVALLHHLDNIYPCDSDQFRFEVMRSIDAEPYCSGLLW